MAKVVITHLGVGSDFPGLPQGSIYLSDLAVRLTIGVDGNSPLTIQRSLAELDAMPNLMALKVAGKISIEITPTVDEIRSGLGLCCRSTGNPALLDKLTSASSVVVLFCSPNGDDATGDGSFGNPFRYPDRAEAEIPSASVAGTPEGNVVIVLLAGNFPRNFVLREKGAPGLTVTLVGDTTIDDANYLLPAGVRPKLTSAPTVDKAASWNYNVGTLGFTPSNGSHWADQPFDFGNGAVVPTAIAAVDATFSTGSNLRLAESYDPALNNSTVHIRPVVSSIDVRGNASGSLTIANENICGTKLVVSGLKIIADYGISFVNTDVYGCVIAGVGGQTVCNHSFNTFTYLGNIWQDSLAQVVIQDGNQCGTAGIFDVNVVIEGPTSEFFVGGVFRGVDGNDVCLYLGGPTGGRIGSATDVEPEGADFENGFVQSQGAASRWGNHAPVTFDGVAHLVVARHDSKMRFQNVQGTSTDDCLVLEPGCHVFSGVAGLSGNVSTTGVGKHEVVLRNDPSDIAPTAHDFADAPVVDTSRLIFFFA